MKKRWSIVAAFLLILVCALGLAACNPNDDGAETHTHTPCETCGLCTDPNCTGSSSEKCLGHTGGDDPIIDELIDGKELKNIALTSNGLLSWSRLKIASKYVLTATLPDKDHKYEIEKSKGTFNLAELPDNAKLGYGKNSMKLTVYEYQEEEIEGEKIGDDVPISSDSFIAVNTHGGYTLTRLNYSDDYVAMDGFYSDVRTDEYGKQYYLYEHIMEGSMKESFNVSKKVQAKSDDYTVKKNSIRASPTVQMNRTQSDVLILMLKPFHPAITITIAARRTRIISLRITI